MQNFEIVFYDKPDGTEPAREFILSLDKKMKARMIQLINMLEKNGSELRMPYSKHIVDGIIESKGWFGYIPCFIFFYHWK